MYVCMYVCMYVYVPLNDTLMRSARSATFESMLSHTQMLLWNM